MHSVAPEPRSLTILSSQRRYEIHFGQIFFAKPTFSESDGSSGPIFPQDCRIRNLTYAAPLYCTMTKRTLIGHENPESMSGEMKWEVEHPEIPDELARVTLGRVGDLCLKEKLV